VRECIGISWSFLGTDLPKLMVRLWYGIVLLLCH